MRIREESVRVTLDEYRDVVLFVTPSFVVLTIECSIKMDYLVTFVICPFERGDRVVSRFSACFSRTNRAEGTDETDL